MLIMDKTFKVDYDKKSDILYAIQPIRMVKESVELSDSVVVDLDDKDQIVGIEIFYAAEFLTALNEKITRKFLSNLKELSLKTTNYQNSQFITLIFKDKNEVIEERLPILLENEIEMVEV